ncbi:VOC family protein [Bradyrhizobium canariense]|uniref:Catechol 2,3-dioxygenase n=1 Tax=Bradyrhizobium canariense TaxID=255045 RepID=A0A1H1NE31_9BRAD|nr:VOC family protein [Bradyrhizobium canariense]SDR97208.1 Catechol 2,3-dioxygenase [Bradyrhizobium canariense]
MPNVDVISVHHVCLVVQDREAADAFYIGVLGFQPHHGVKSWLVLNDTSTLHLVAIPGTAPRNASPHRPIQHFALQVSNLANVLTILLQAGQKPFQMDGKMKEHFLVDPGDPLTFGTGTLFVRDPDGNLIEFIEEGKGLFSVEMRPRLEIVESNPDQSSGNHGSVEGFSSSLGAPG